MGESPEWPSIHVTQIEEIDGRRIESVLTSPVCDLCGDIYPAWDYDCSDFAIHEIDFASMGEWAACNQCSELIELGDYEKLLKRSLDNHEGREHRSEWEPRIRRIHQTFRENRIGERKAWG